MKVYILVKVYDEGAYGRTRISTRGFSSIKDAQTALVQEREQFKECNDVERGSIFEDGLHFSCKTEDYRHNGTKPQITFEIKDNELW